jgi:hypothetical protein
MAERALDADQRRAADALSQRRARDGERILLFAGDCSKRSEYARLKVQD